jgi:phosphoglucosamine mutase
MTLFGSSGIRAVFDKDLLDIAYRVGLAVGKRCGKVVVARDTRTSGEAMKHAVIAGLLAAGAQCSDAGIAPTPTLAFLTRDFDAGIMVTASHNPPQYNGVKLLNPDGSSFGAAQQTEIEKDIALRSAVVPWDKIQPYSLYQEPLEPHLKGILADFPDGLKVKVVVDAGCGAAAEVTPRLLKQMGCEINAINCYPSGFFPRDAEPVDANLTGLKDAVREFGADLGIAHDGDADRMMAVDDKGRFIPGDKLLAIFASTFKVGTLVTTLDASMAIDEIGFEVRRTRIGDTYVSEELKNGGDFGGETSGAWIFPRISLCPDGIYAAAQMVFIASQQKISDMVDKIPSYPLLRGNMSSQGVVMSRLEDRLADLSPRSMGKIDGIKLDFDNGWLLVRPSGTEPKIRITAEARNEADAQHLYDKGIKAIRDSIA